MKEDYVSFEVAKLLKEKGFDWECEHVIWEGADDNYENYDKAIPNPTLQMAMKWLREVHKLHISVDVSPIYGKVKDEKGRNTCSLLYWNYMASGEWMNDKYNPQQKAFVMSAKSYEEAVEAACIYALKNLI